MSEAIGAAYSGPARLSRAGLREEGLRVDRAVEAEEGLGERLGSSRAARCPMPLRLASVTFSATAFMVA